MTVDLIRIGLDQPADYRMGMLTVARRALMLAMGDAGPAILLGQSLPIVTTGDSPTPVNGEPTARPGGPTWFGPGVLLVSPVVFADVATVHEALLQAGEATCAEYGVTTVRRPHYAGLWIERDGWHKIASIGLAHEGPVVAGGGGLALLVDPDLRVFDDFDACGIPDVRMTSLAAESGRVLTVAEVADVMAGHLQRILAPALLTPERTSA